MLRGRIVDAGSLPAAQSLTPACAPRAGKQAGAAQNSPFDTAQGKQLANVLTALEGALKALLQLLK